MLHVLGVGVAEMIEHHDLFCRYAGSVHQEKGDQVESANEPVGGEQQPAPADDQEGGLHGVADAPVRARIDQLVFGGDGRDRRPILSQHLV
jgi:hypothetical protein